MKKYILFLLFFLAPYAHAASFSYGCSDFTVSGSASCMGGVFTGSNMSLSDDGGGVPNSYYYELTAGTWYVSFDLTGDSNSMELNCDSWDTGTCSPSFHYSSGSYVDQTLVITGGTAGLVLMGNGSASWSASNICIASSPNECRPIPPSPMPNVGSYTYMDFGAGLALFWFVVEAFTATGVLVIFSLVVYIIAKAVGAVVRFH